MRITADNDGRASCKGTLQHAVVCFVVSDLEDSLARIDPDSELTNQNHCFANPALRPSELFSEHSFDLSFYRRRDEESRCASTSQGQNLIGHSAKVESRNANIRVRDEPEHSAPRSILLYQPLDFGFSKAKPARMRTSELLKVEPSAVRQVAAERLA